jgi:hypothetical protein
VIGCGRGTLVSRAALSCILGLSMPACGSGGSDDAANTDRATLPSSALPADPDSAGAARARIGVVFDPSRVRPGDTIAGLVVRHIAAARAIDSSLVGSITFNGQLELAGRTVPHPEADASDAACFEADSASAARLPRWAGDRRRAWFCFSNATEANRSLGPSWQERRAHVVIADFVINRGLTDQVNSARFVGLGDSVVGASRDPDRMLERAAREIVAFLNGKTAFDKIPLADTVILYLSPEGGGTRAAFARESLRTPSKWVVRSGRQSYSFVPPATLTKLTAKSGRHFNCAEYALASRFPDLAKLPHVGVKLEPETTGSCLQTWNATFVFDTIERSPRLVAAVYDQWEW